MADFHETTPTLENCWRSVILFGRNVASYKFALGKALLDLGGRADDLVRLEDLAGSFGRDAKAFLELGHEAVAFDASEAMARHVSALLGQPVRHLRFEELEDIEIYDGVWCSASLLHVPERDSPGVFARIARAMKPDGVCYMSFKLGRGERTKEGRVFTDQDEASLGAHLAALPALEVLDLWRTTDRRPDRSQEQWLNALARKRRDFERA